MHQLVVNISSSDNVIIRWLSKQCNIDGDLILLFTGVKHRAGYSHLITTYKENGAETEMLENNVSR